MFVLIMSLLWPCMLRAQTPLPEVPAGTADQMFHVALVIADNGSGGDSGKPLTGAAQKAIDDIRGFLPFSRYRLADSGLARVKSHGKISLRGPDNQLYAANIAFRQDKDGAKKSFLIDNFALSKEREPNGDRPLLAPGVAPEPADQPLVASFRVELGETVVVGSSRLEGDDRAIVVLLTAVP